MKTMLKLAAFALMIGCTAFPCGAADSKTSTSTSEDLGFDFYQGRTNKIASVYAVTPTHIQVTYTNGGRSRQIPRTELSGELARLYPYDEDKAATYLAQKSTEAVQRAATQQAVWQAAQQSALAQREKATQAELAQLTQRDTQLQKEVNMLHNMPRGNGRKVRLAHLLAEQQSIREKAIKLRSQLSAMR